MRRTIDFLSLRCLIGAPIRWVLAVTLTLPMTLPAGSTPPVALACTLDLGATRDHFNLERDLDVARLRDFVTRALRLAEEHRRARGELRERIQNGRPLEELSAAELTSYHHEPAGQLTRKDRRGLEELKRLANLTGQSSDPKARRSLLVEMVEVATALTLNRRPPIPARIDVVELPLVHYDYANNPIAVGRKEAWNLEPARTNPEQKDASLRQPLPSSFWNAPDDLSARDLFNGFGRAISPRVDEEMLVYHEPKTSFGGHAGFTARSNGRELKIKFGEVHSEAFAARIFWALGYHVDTTDYAARLLVQYNRRLFREFNQRREVSTRISALGLLPVYTLRFQPRRDPFAFLAEAVLKDGTRWSPAQLRTNLYRDAFRDNPAEDPANFRPEIEQAIDYLVTTPANVQIKDPTVHSIGPWSFGGLNHEGRRELRGAGLLAAWIGWSDSRFENTRLKRVDGPDGPRLRHYFTDLGGGLGRSTGLVYRQGELPNDFPWTFTRAPKVQGKGRMTIPFRITGYEPIEDTPAFEQLTVDDARWMARWIGRLTERQILEALMASGFDSARVRLYLEKLICRRDQMIRDLDLTGDVPLLRPDGVNQVFNYDPDVSGPVSITTSSGRRVEASCSRFVVQNGTVISPGDRVRRAHPPESGVSQPRLAP